MSRLALRPEVFAILSHLIEEKTGIHYSPSETELLAEKISPIALEAGFDSLLDYYYFLRYDDAKGDAFVALADALVVHETYFFRELEPLKMAVETVIEPLVKSGKRARIWSAACATGEEPLTVAMLLADRGLLGSVDIVASDISARALARAQRGDFNRRTLRSVPNGGLAEKYLVRDGDRVVPKPELTKAISWKQINLVAPERGQDAGVFDLVLCRNVLIYFAEETVMQVLKHLGQRLSPSGILLVGVSESLLRFGTMFECEERRGVFCYRKARS